MWLTYAECNVAFISGYVILASVDTGLGRKCALTSSPDNHWKSSGLQSNSRRHGILWCQVIFRRSAQRPSSLPHLMTRSVFACHWQLIAIRCRKECTGFGYPFHHIGAIRRYVAKSRLSLPSPSPFSSANPTSSTHLQLQSVWNVRCRYFFSNISYSGDTMGLDYVSDRSVFLVLSPFFSRLSERQDSSDWVIDFRREMQSAHVSDCTRFCDDRSFNPCESL
jgi:hypothetical protein